MKRFSIVHIPPLSFFSKYLYVDVGMNWRGLNFSYLLLLLAICWIPRVLRIDKEASQFIETKLPPIIKQVPEITITDGEASIKETQPYFIRNPDSNDVLAIIDTTGKISSLGKTGAYCLLTKKTLIVRQSNVETREYNFSQVKNFVLTGGSLMNWAYILKKVIIVALYPAAIFGSFIFRIIQSLVYAAIGLLFASWCRVNLMYEALIRLAVVAVTPCIIINTILTSAGINLPHNYLIYFLTAMVYLLFGVKAVADTAAQQENQTPPDAGGV